MFLFHNTIKWKFLASDLSKTLINYVWPISRVTGWLIVTFAGFFKADLTRFLGTCDSNSSTLITTGETINSWVPNRRNTSNWPRFDDDITFICQKENMNTFSRRFDKLFWCNFDRWKFDVVSTCFVRLNFVERKKDVISM